MFSQRLLHVEPLPTLSSYCSINRGVVKMSASASIRWGHRCTYLGLPLLVVLALDMSGTIALDGPVPSDKGITLRQPCGLRTCDLRTHYCDEVIGDCARCDDDCHPGRIGGDARATEDCQRICQCKRTNCLLIYFLLSHLLFIGVGLTLYRDDGVRSPPLRSGGDSHHNRLEVVVTVATT